MNHDSKKRVQGQLKNKKIIDTMYKKLFPKKHKTNTKKNKPNKNKTRKHK
jgi:hypothetical protein